MHSNVTIKNVSWPHFSWPTLYIVNSGTVVCGQWSLSMPGSQNFCFAAEMNTASDDNFLLLLLLQRMTQ